MPPRKNRSAPPTGRRSSDDNHFLYGPGVVPMPLSSSLGQLPTCQQVDLHIERSLSKVGVTFKEDGVIKEAAAEIKAIWQSLTNIDLKQDKFIIQQIKKLRVERRKALKDKGKYKLPSGKSRSAGKKSIPNFRNKMKRLFDIHSHSTQIKDEAFLNDQQTSRLQYRVGRGQRQTEGSEGPSPGERGREGEDIEPQESLDNNAVDLDLLLGPGEDSGDSSSSDQWEPEAKMKPSTPREKLKTELLEVGERFGLSNEALKAVHNIYASGSGLSSRESVRKLRQKERLSAATIDLSHTKIVALGFDERKDISRVSSTSVERQEHCSVVAVTELDESIYLGSFEPKSGLGIDLAQGLFDFSREKNLDLSNLVGLVSDGCNKMVGQFKGAHKHFEKLLGRPLQRVLCFFHHIELSFKGIMAFHQFNTTGPGTVTEPWAELIVGDIHLKDPVNFDPIPDPFVLDIINNMDKEVSLSTDHSIIIGLLKTVMTGEIDHRVNRKIGPIVHSRFTTTEARTLRSYISHPNPPEHLKRVVAYLIHVQAPVFLFSKMFQQAHFMGPKLLLLELMLGRKFLTNDEFSVLEKKLNFNGQMAHSENVLYSMLCSPVISERKFAIQAILDIRERGSGAGTGVIRKFERNSHILDPKAVDITTLNPLLADPSKNHEVTEPPATLKMSVEELQSVIFCPLRSLFPISSVAVERAVKDTTRAALMASTSKERDGIVQMSIKARKKRES